MVPDTQHRVGHHALVAFSAESDGPAMTALDKDDLD